MTHSTGLSLDDRSKGKRHGTIREWVCVSARGTGEIFRGQGSDEERQADILQGLLNHLLVNLL